MHSSRSRIYIKKKEEKKEKTGPNSGFIFRVHFPPGIFSPAFPDWVEMGHPFRQLYTVIPFRNCS
jgi:hypothetical protein